MTESPDNPFSPKANPLRRLYAWVLHYADHPHAVPALFFIAFAEATVFPIPPDVLLLAMAMAAPSKALWFAVVCTAGSVFGGIVGYAMGWGFWSSFDGFFYHFVPGFSESNFQLMAEKFADNTFLTIFTAGFTPIPFKIFTIAAGAAAVPIVMFVLGALISRGLRFGLLAALIWYAGPSIKQWIDRYFNLLTLIATVLLIGGLFLLASVEHSP